MKKTNFKIIIPSYNVEKWVEKHIRQKKKYGRIF